MYSPKINEKLIPIIHKQAKKQRIPMTKLVNRILEKELKLMENLDGVYNLIDSLSKQNPIVSLLSLEKKMPKGQEIHLDELIIRLKMNGLVYDPYYHDCPDQEGKYIKIN